MTKINSNNYAKQRSWKTHFQIKNPLDQEEVFKIEYLNG